MLSAPAAHANDMDKCMGEIRTIAEMKADEDTPDIGEKAEAMVDNLTEVAGYLCEQKKYDDASQLMEVARGMLVSE